MGWEYKIAVAKVLKAQAKLKFDTDEAVRLLNEIGRSAWELIDVSLVGSEAMFTFNGRGNNAMRLNHYGNDQLIGDPA